MSPMNMPNEDEGYTPESVGALSPQMEIGMINSINNSPFPDKGVVLRENH